MPTSKILAAVDLGSNSFHMIVAVIEDGQVHVLDKIREMVRLGGGLDEAGNLDPETAERALECLSRFGQRLKDIPPPRVRIVGTMTLRQMKNAEKFIIRAENAIGHSIETISGAEEARLIYQGVAHTHIESNRPRMIIDIGGRSTEIIVGKGEAIKALVSTAMGCVSMSQHHFPDGMITETNMTNAETAARLVLRPHEETYRNLKWNDAIGASGTAKALRDIAQENNWCLGEISQAALDNMRTKFLNAGHLNNVNIAGLSDERKPVILGGLIIMRALFDALNIQTMTISEGALREGVLYDMVEKKHAKNIRKRTIRNLQKRYLRKSNKQHKRIMSVLKPAFEQVKKNWSLNREDKNLLFTTIEIHEIGRRIALSGYHRHGAYLIEHSAMPGFSQLEQHILATLVKNQRGGIKSEGIKSSPARRQKSIKRLIALLRLGSLLYRSRSQSRHLPEIEFHADDDKLTLNFPKKWINKHPLTQADLAQEQALLKKLDIQLCIQST